jgi:DNA primase
MIPPKTVQEIIDTARIDDVVGEFVNLKRRGSNMIGLCPFHNEKTPSFVVSPGKNIFKCFGCGRAGDSAKFLMEHEHYTYPEALRYLGKKYGIHIQERELTREEREARQLADSLFIVNTFAREYFQDQLLQTDRGKSVGLSYFKNRGFREELIKKFELGFAPQASDALTQAANKAGYNKDFLQKLGLTTQYGRDFFRDRVMFTIHNMTGKPVAFAGRILDKNAKAAKYINSPETEIYVKSKILYGAYFAQRSIRKEDRCYLVEGYTDVLSLHQGGIENVVASSGTSLTIEQVRLIRRMTSNLTILYDGDDAGRKAALRGMDLALVQDLNVRVVLLPDGEDPDSYLSRVGATAFKEFIEQEEKDFILFKMEAVAAAGDGDPVRKSEMVKELILSVSKIPDPLKRSDYLRICAQQLGIDERALVAEMNNQLRQTIRQDRRNKEQKERREALTNDESSAIAKATPDELSGSQLEVPTDEYQEKDLIRILIAAGGQLFDKEEQISVAEYLLSNIEEVINEFDNPLYGKVANECLQLLLDKQPITPQSFINHSDPEIKNLALDILQSPFEYSPGWEERWEIYLRTQKMPELNFTSDSIQSLLRFKLRKVIKLCDKNQERIKEQTEKDPEKIMRLLKVHQKLTTVRNELAEQLRTVVIK